MPFRQYKAEVGIPTPQWAERAKVERAITVAYPGMKVEFRENTRLHLVGVQAPDRQSAAVILPALDLLVSKLN